MLKAFKFYLICFGLERFWSAFWANKRFTYTVHIGHYNVETGGGLKGYSHQWFPLSIGPTFPMNMIVPNVHTQCMGLKVISPFISRCFFSMATLCKTIDDLLKSVLVESRWVEMLVTANTFPINGLPNSNELHESKQPLLSNWEKFLLLRPRSISNFTQSLPFYPYLLTKHYTSFSDQ